MSPALLHLDANATTRPCPEAVAAMQAALLHAWGNPSSTHAAGQAARRLLAEARTQVARLVGCQPAMVVFTSGATEANAMALHGAAIRATAPGATRRRVLVSAVEHAGLLAVADALAARGLVVERLPVDADGRVDLDVAARRIDADVALVSVMAANNETGVLQPIDALSTLTRAAGAALHVDATQAVGRTGLRFCDGRADLWSLSAHKLHGPKGVGALVIAKGLDWPVPVPGHQERHRRGGTENLPGIAGFGAAAERALRDPAADAARLARHRDRLERALVDALPGTVVVAGGVPRLPNTSLLRFGTVDAEAVLARLERAGVLASSGSACTAGGTEPSHVLRAMGLPDDQARACVRLSLDRDTPDADLDAAADRIAAAVAPLLAEALQPA